MDADAAADPRGGEGGAATSTLLSQVILEIVCTVANGSMLNKLQLLYTLLPAIWLSLR